MRKEIPMVITVLAVVAMVFSVYIHIGSQWELDQRLDQWFLTSFGFAILVGVINLTRLHVKNIQRRREGWLASVFLLVAMYFYMITALFQTVEGPITGWIFNAVNVPASATMYGMVVFFIFSAAFRAFRLRTLEATVLMISAVVVMLGSAPIGDVLIPGWSGVKEWIMSVPVTTAYRGITIGAYLGAFATAVRIMLGLERAHMRG